MTWLGLDIGGANIKAATSDGNSCSVPFSFWVEHRKLGQALSDIILRFPASHIATTMTAELADCFESRRQGVEWIVDCLAALCNELDLPAPVFAGTDVRFRDAPAAKKHWLKTAASNWAMTSSYAARFLSDPSGALIDIGSTTTDIIPIKNGLIATQGKTDSERMIAGELIYVGVDRTPACSVVNSLTHNNIDYPIAAELFATVGDAMLICGLVDEDVKNCNTADGRSRTVANASQRICSMICEDLETIGADAARSFAKCIWNSVFSLVSNRFTKLQKQHKFTQAIVTGSGAKMILPELQAAFPRIRFMQLGSESELPIDTVAPAYATAVIANESSHS